MAKWTADNIPDLTGKVIVVTGANSGLGLETTRELAGKGAQVIMACRNPDKAKDAVSDVRENYPRALLDVMSLDLSSLASVRRFAKQLHDKHRHIDVLVNNAGIMAIPYNKTTDGFEMHFGTNHLGHFALTGLLFDLLLAAKQARIVNVSSQAHVMGKMRWDDLNWERDYSKWGAYGMSKLANLLFTFELGRRSQEKALPIISVAAHPGYSATNLQYVGADMAGDQLTGKLSRAFNPLLGQPASMGALPQLYAICASDVASNDYIGPDGWFGVRGYPTKATPHKRAQDTAAWQKLWDVSETLTSVRFPALA